MAQDPSLQFYPSILSEAMALAVSSLRPLLPAPKQQEPHFNIKRAEEAAKVPWCQGGGSEMQVDTACPWPPPSKPWQKGTVE